MNRCTKCGTQTLAGGPQDFEKSIGRRVFVGKVQGYECSSCNGVFYDQAAIGAFEEKIARYLAQRGISTPEEMRFARKAVGIAAIELAKLLEVSPETVSHWENGKHPADVATRATLAGLVLDGLDGGSFTRDLLRNSESPDASPRVPLDLEDPTPIKRTPRPVLALPKAPLKIKRRA